jgi:microcystin degradation protein MlrC
VKAVLAQFIFESNTFSPAGAPVELFTRGGTWLEGEGAVRAWAGRSDLQMGASLGVLEGAGWETAPVFAAVCGSPAGRLGPGAFEAIRGGLGRAVEGALPADGVVLHLHGAACADGEDDVEGNLLAMVRDEIGYAGPLVVSLDLHANVTRRMLRHADAVTAYRTMPHMDFAATGARAARLLLGHREGRGRTLAKVAALIPPTCTDHAAGGFSEILSRARALEERPGVADVSVFPVQPWLDVGELGTSVVVTGDDPAAGEAAARELAETWYGQRGAWTPGVRPWGEIIPVLMEKRAEPWILVDAADATSGGSPGRSSEAVRALLPLRNALPGEVLLCVVDPLAVAAAEAGARRFRLGDPEVELEARVIRTGEGAYRARGRGYTGQLFSMGRTAVLATGRLRIVVSTDPAFGSDPAFFECLGLRPETALAVHVKSIMGWRAGYDAASSRGLIFDGPGCTSLEFARLPFTGERRDLFPLRRDPPAPVTLWRSP